MFSIFLFFKTLPNTFSSIGKVTFSNNSPCLLSYNLFTANWYSFNWVSTLSGKYSEFSKYIFFCIKIGLYFVVSFWTKFVLFNFKLIKSNPSFNPLFSISSSISISNSLSISISGGLFGGHCPLNNFCFSLCSLAFLFVLFFALPNQFHYLPYFQIQLFLSKFHHLYKLNLVF